MPLFDMDPNTSNNLMNFGFSTMAASQQPGQTLGGAIGQGGMGMNQAALQQAQMKNIGQEATGKTLNNALTLRQLNIGNAALGLNPINMQGVPDLLNQKAAPTTTSPWSQTSGSSLSAPTTRDQLSDQSATGFTGLGNDYGYNTPQINNNSQSASNQSTVPLTLQKMFPGVSQGVLEVATRQRSPANRDEALQASRIANIIDPEFGKQLSTVSLEGLKPTDLRPGGSRIDPLGNTTVAPAHLQTTEGYTVPFSPAPVTYGNGAGGKNGAVSSNGDYIPPSDSHSSNISNGIKTAYSPRETATQKNYFGPETQAYNGAQSAMQNLQLMQHSIDTLNTEPGFFSTGSAGAGRIAFGKAANTFLTGIGADTLDESKIAAGESLFKTTGRLGFNMSKQLGSREPGVITERAIALNPGMDNTPKGVQLLKNSVQEEQQRIIDEHNFKGNYYGVNGYNQQSAEAKFDSQYKPELYAKRATSQLDPIKVNNFSGAKQLLVGTKVKFPDGKIKIVPQGGGIDAPAYSDVTQPMTPVQPLEDNTE